MGSGRIAEGAELSTAAVECEGDLAERLASVSARGKDGKFAPFEFAPSPHPEFYGMGHALYSTAGDYMRFLRMFLNEGTLDGKRVLSENGVATMLANHIGDLRVGQVDHRGTTGHGRFRSVPRHAEDPQPWFPARGAERAGNAFGRFARLGWRA